MNSQHLYLIVSIVIIYSFPSNNGRILKGKIVIPLSTEFPHHVQIASYDANNVLHDLVCRGTLIDMR